ncbi:MAG: MerC domain-containing protein [Balneolaceae bacterium]
MFGTVKDFPQVNRTVIKKHAEIIRKAFQKTITLGLEMKSKEMIKKENAKVGFWDRMGIGLSGICAIHCLLVPVFVSLIPLWPAFGDFHELTHLIFFLAIAPAVILSIKHRKNLQAVSGFLFVGLTVIFVAWFFNNELGRYGEAGVTLIGSFLLIRGHWLNYKTKTMGLYKV